MNFNQIPKPFHETLWRPAADVYRCPEGWLIKFDLAGVRPEEVEVHVRGCCLTVSGVRRDWVMEAGHRFYSMEISYNRFQRSVELPCDLGSAQIKIDYHYGMLLVRLLTEPTLP